MQGETHAGREARARQEAATTENADDAPATVDRLSMRVDLPCGASIPHQNGNDVEALCADDSTCGHDATYAVTRADGSEVAVCGNHLPDSEPTTRERAAADGGDDLPADPFDRSPEDYDVSDTLAALEDGDTGDGERPDSELVSDGGALSAESRVECYYCGSPATGFDEQVGVHLCDDCDSVAAVTDHEAVVRACSLVESDARFIMLCFDCRRSKSFIAFTEAVKQARTDDRTHDCDCGGEYELVIDATADPSVRQSEPTVDADLTDGVPRCRTCGEVIVVRSGPAYERCVECLLADLAADEDETPDR